MLPELNYAKILHKKKKTRQKKDNARFCRKKEVSSIQIETDTQASFVERFTNFATDIIIIIIMQVYRLQLDLVKAGLSL